MRRGRRALWQHYPLDLKPRVLRVEEGTGPERLHYEESPPPILSTPSSTLSTGPGMYESLVSLPVSPYFLCCSPPMYESLWPPPVPTLLEGG